MGSRWLVVFVLAGCGKRCAHDGPSIADASPDAAIVSVVDANIEDRVVAKLETPDPCPSVDADYASRMRIKHAQLFDTDFAVQSSALPDLNGDGQAEIYRALGPSAAWIDKIPPSEAGERDVHVYLGGAPCAVVVATFSEPFEVLKTRHDGWADLRIQDFSICEGASCGCVPADTFYIHTAGGYVEDPKRSIKPMVKPCAH